MYISLDNNNFYYYPPPFKPSKPPRHAFPTSGGMSYQVPSTPQSFSHPLPPKAPPVCVTSTVATSTIKYSQCTAASRNMFDVELENVSATENSPIVREVDLEMDRRCGSQDGNALGVSRCRHTLALVPSSMTSKLPKTIADASDGEGSGAESAVQENALGHQSDSRTQSPGDATCSLSPTVPEAEAESDYSVDSLPAHQDSLRWSLAGRKTNNQRMSIDSVPDHHDPRLPSPALLDLASRPQTEPRVGTRQYHETTFENLPSEAASCEEWAGDLIGRESTVPSVSPNNPTSRESSTHHEGNCTPVLYGSIHKPQDEEQPRLTLSHGRVLRPRAGKQSCRQQPCRPNRLPSIAAILPVRRSDRLRLMTKTSTGSSVQPSPGRHQDRKSDDGQEDRPTCDLNENDSLAAEEFDAREAEQPRKRRRQDSRSKKPAGNSSVSTGNPARGCKGPFQTPSEVGFLTSPGETQEIFGRGIIRIQPHGHRHAIYLTFLPDAVHRPLSPSPPELPSAQPPRSDPHSRKQQESRPVKGGNCRKRRAYSPAENQHDCNETQVSSRKGMPWSTREVDLLLKLRRDERRSWSEVKRLFSEQYPGRSKGSIQVYWSTTLKNRAE